MTNPKKVHCLFEQSGTFKNEFIKLGYEAEDYDIQNDFGETDNVVDLFNEIEKAYCYRDSIFDKFNKNDIVMAFFPCVRFEDQIIMGFKGTSFQYKNYNDEQKLQTDMKLHKELHDLYEYITMLAIVCIRGEFRTVIENPFSSQHYLTRYWAINSKVVDSDRRKDGDYFKKPSQYWFINFDPKCNILFDPIPVNTNTFNVDRVTKEDTEKAGCKDRKVLRSMISPVYANRFIRQYIVDSESINDL